MKKWMKSMLIIVSGMMLLVITGFVGNEFVKLNEELTIVENKYASMESEFQLVQSENRFFQSEYELMQFHMNELLTRRNEDKDYFKEALETERLRTVVHNGEEEGDENSSMAGYLTWEQANQIADMFYKDSEGRFKREWGKFLALEATDKEIDPFLIYELLRVETGGKFDPEAVGPQTQYGHAYGLAQFMKNTSPWIAEMADLPYEHDLLFDPLYSIQLAVTYLDFLYDQYGDWDHALTAYHRGIYGLQNYIEQNGHARSWYAVEIQEEAQKHHGEGELLLASR